MPGSAMKTIPETAVVQRVDPTPPPRSWARDIPQRFAVIGVWIAMAVLFAVLLPQTFLTYGAFRAIFGGQQALVFLAAALLVTIIVGEFVDMSVAANFGFAAIVVPVLYTTYGWNVWLAIITAIVASTLVGLVNAWLIVKVGVNTIVVTLGMSTVLLGISLGIANMTAVSGLPGWLGQALQFNLLGLPITFYLGLVLMLGFAYVLAFTPLGRNMRFVGANREVARLAGVRVTRIRMGAFVIAGLIAGLGGVIAASATGGFDPNVANMYLLPMFAAVFLGTAILQPGRFTPLGALIAVYFLATGVLGLQLLGASSWVSNVFYGGVLVIAVTLSTVLSRRR
ncbi:ABC transporter permease [Agromyces sp. NPDC056379]|uniref:ABC transporter permease n=1 Tax=unclassified Agromyces TaxID=2639701 RepID=UPI0035E2C7BE